MPLLMALPPDVTLTAVNSGPEGVTVEWSVSSPELRSTLESRDSLEGGEWAPVPGAEWPIAGSSFVDTRALSLTRFYRVRFEPAPVDRGRVISSQVVQTLTRQQIQFIFAIGGIPVTADRDVVFRKVIYETVDPHGLRTVASAALAVPVGVTTPLPLVSYQHGTVLEREDVPSRLNTEGYLGVAFATSGYAAVLPDYLGLGDSPGLHPYHHARSQATTVVDALRAARTFLASTNVALNDQVFLTGYSQGGHATLAALREFETHHTNEFTITACAPAAGAYDLSVTTANDFLSERPQPNPYYFPYLLAAFQDVYGLTNQWGNLLRDPYATNLPSKFDGMTSGGAINALLPATPTQILQPDVLDDFVTNPESRLRAALRDNDLIHWTPRSPLRLYHCAGDLDVTPANTQVAHAAFQARGATQVERYDPDPTANHGGCVEPSLLAVKAWFDGLRQ